MQRKPNPFRTGVIPGGYFRYDGITSQTNRKVNPHAIWQKQLKKLKTLKTLKDKK